MATWEEIRDEIAGMLADGQPLEDVISKLEKRKNEMAKPLTNEEWLKQCTTEQLAEWFANNGFLTCPLRDCDDCEYYDKKNDDCDDVTDHKHMWVEWLKQPHQ